MSTQSNLIVNLSNAMIILIDNLSYSFQNKVEKQFPGINYQYKCFGLNELSNMAKKDANAKNEILLRMTPIIKRFALKYYKNHRYIDFDELYMRLMSVTMTAIEIYSISKGDFINLLRKMLFYSIRYYAKDLALNYSRQVKYLGNRINESEVASYLCDVESEGFDSNVEKDIQLKIDLESYMEELSIIDHSILELHLNQFTLKQISEYTNLSIASISLKLQIMYSELISRHKRGLI